MEPLIIAAVIIMLFYGGLRWFVRAKPSQVVAQGRKTLLAVGVGLVVVLAMTGRIGFAVPLAFILFGLYKQGIFGSYAMPAQAKAPTGPARRSLVRTAALEMEIDHITGMMSGRVLVGSFEGKDLDSLGIAGIARLAQEISSDPESRQLLEVYMDRRAPGWREHMKADMGAGQRRPPRPGAMSEEEAYQVLGLEKGAGEPEIRAAYRRLIKKVHPDQGGSTFLAARINEAKDRLLSKHR